MVSSVSSTTEVTMPQMGAEMEEGTLLRWIKHPGDHVDRGEVIAEIETDKANIEIEAFDEGFLQQTLVEEGAVVPVGQVIALIGKGGQGEASTPAEATGARAPLGEQQSAPPAVQQPAAAPNGPDRQAPPQTSMDRRGQRIRVSPVASSIAQELGVDLTAIAGSGPDGRIMRKDVERAAVQRETAGAGTPPKRSVDESDAEAPAGPMPTEAAEARPPQVVSESPAPSVATQKSTSPDSVAAPPSPPQAPLAPTTAPDAPPRPAGAPGVAGSENVVPFSRMRQAIARTMAASKREVPHYYITAEVDMTDAMQFRASLNKAAGEPAGQVHISVNDLIVKASAEVLRRYPRFNASYGESGVRMHERINICIAVALADGLIAPALLDAGSRSLGAVSREAKDLADRARSGGLKGPEISDGTFTISNLGMYGIETLVPIIQPPQSAVLGVGAVQEKPAVRDGQIVIRKLMMVALAADHRVTDGAEGGEFLRELKHLLEHPIGLAL